MRRNSLFNRLRKIRNLGWTIKIIPKLKQEVSVIHFSAFDLLRISFVAASAFLLTAGFLFCGGSRQKARVQTLSNSLQFEDVQMKRMEDQKAEMQNLLSQKADRLEAQLLQMRREEQQLQKLLLRGNRAGEAAGAQVAWQPRRFTLKSSRGGSCAGLVNRLFDLDRQIGLEQSILDRAKRLIFLRRGRWEEEKQKLAAAFEKIPSRWPAAGEITSGFGYRTQPIDGGSEFHTGLDIACPYGSVIKAAAGGACVYAGYKEGFGLTVLVDHGNGLATQYSHCSRLLTHAGAEIKKGENVALVGSTGYSTGPHVHYEVHYHDRPVNPLEFLDLTLDKWMDRGGGIRRLVSKQ